MLKVGIVGTGFMARTHAEAYAQLGTVQVAGFTANNAERGQKVAAEFGGEYFAEYAAMLARDDIQIIDICAPTHVHESLVIQAAEAGKHIICEKPIALSLEEVDRMISATKRANVKFMVAQVLRFWPEYRLVKKIVEEGDLGPIHSISAGRLAQHPDWNPWFKVAEQSGGALFDIQVHDIDYLYHLLGPVESVYAIGHQSENGAWNHVVSNLNFKNGTRASVEGSAIMPDGFPFSTFLRVVGDKGAIDYRFTAGFNIENLDSADHHFQLFKQGESPEALKVEQENAFVEQLGYFVDCVLNDREPEFVKPDESRAVLEVMLAIKRSLETGQIQFVASGENSK